MTRNEARAVLIGEVKEADEPGVHAAKTEVGGGVFGVRGPAISFAGLVDLQVKGGTPRR